MSFFFHPNLRWYIRVGWPCHQESRVKRVPEAIFDQILGVHLIKCGFYLPCCHVILALLD